MMMTGVALLAFEEAGSGGVPVCVNLHASVPELALASLSHSTKQTDVGTKQLQLNEPVCCCDSCVTK
jgi:hypothetical protein